MNIAQLKQQIHQTPAFVLDEAQVLANMQALLAIRQRTQCKILYSMKALPLAAVLHLLKKQLDGVSASSLFEAQLARQVIGDQASVHLTSPGLRPHEFQQISHLCSHISFNSISQYQRLQALGDHYSKGLRINPKLSFADDSRYDPCAAHSRLGEDIQILQRPLPETIQGLHMHTMFAGLNFEPLLQTLNKLLPLLAHQPHLQWLNLGGGYLYPRISDTAALIQCLNSLHQRGLQVYLEPGNALVGNAGLLITSVLDKINSDGKTVLVLDTTVNHHPEVFEYQKSPMLFEADATGSHSAILAGSSCMAGDLFGEYRFQQLPDVGDRLCFLNVGAYSLIKANRFNGYNLPDIYRYNQEALTLDKQYNYADYWQQWGM